MMTPSTTPSPHLWLSLLEAVDPERLDEILPAALPPRLTAPVSAHRNLCGPYTAAGTLARALVPDAVRRWPDLVDRHQIELLSVAPELRSLVSASRETLTSLAVPRERTRYYAAARTRRLSHGIVEFLHEYCRRAGVGRRSLLVHGADSADPTDLEFLSILLRRTHPDLLTVVVCTGPGAPSTALVEALDAHTRRHDARMLAADRPSPDLSDLDLAARYVDSDCTTTVRTYLDAYHRIPAEQRELLHDRRARAISDSEHLSASYGALPYHRERGSDPQGCAVEALTTAIHHCTDMGFYDAGLDLGRRGRELVPFASFTQWWLFTNRTIVALTALGRLAEVDTVLREALTLSQSPRIHMQAAYMTAMLHTRYKGEQQRDNLEAKRLLNRAAAFASLLPDDKERMFHTVFHHNGLALVESHLGNLPGALQLVSDGIALLDAELDPEEHRLHRSVLVHNRAQVLAGLGRLDEALEGFDDVISIDPNYPDYHLDRGNLLRRLGRDPEALSSYDIAIRLAPPFPEAQYNRAELMLDAGDSDQATAILDYVLDLEPAMVDALVNRAGIHLDHGELALAERDARAGLDHDPDNPYLHTALGQIHHEHGAHHDALREFDHALRSAPDLVPALLARAATAIELGDDQKASTDLDRAVAIAPEDPVTHFNRAYLLRKAGRWTEALDDLTVAAALDPDDDDIAEALHHCRARTVPA